MYIRITRVIQVTGLYFLSFILNLDRAVRVGYPPKRFKPHFWFSRPDCPLTQTGHLDIVFKIHANRIDFQNTVSKLKSIYM